MIPIHPLHRTTNHTINNQITTSSLEINTSHCLKKDTNRMVEQSYRYILLPYHFTSKQSKYNQHITSTIRTQFIVILLLHIFTMTIFDLAKVISAFNPSMYRNGIGKHQLLFVKNRHMQIQRSTTATRYLLLTTKSQTMEFSTTTATTTPVSSSPILLQHIEFKSNTSPTTSDSTSQHTQQQQQPVIIFLHGLLGNKRNFASIGRSIASSSSSMYKIYSLDLRNHGDTYNQYLLQHAPTDHVSNSIHLEDMSYRTMAYDVLHFCNIHNIQQIDTLIGHSIGGKVAQAVALLEPSRVKGLIVLDIAPVQYTSKEPHWLAVEDIIRALMNVEMSTNRNSVEQQLRQLIPDPNLRAFCLTNVDWNTGQWKIPLHHIYDQLEILASFDLKTMDTYPSSASKEQSTQTPEKKLVYTGDAFFINGGQSKFVRSSHLSSVQEYFPNHMLTTIKGAGHWVHAEAPEDTTALIQQFLNRSTKRKQHDGN